MVQAAVGHVLKNYNEYFQTDKRLAPMKRQGEHKLNVRGKAGRENGEIILDCRTEE